MERIRVHELAHGLGRQNKEVMDFLKASGLDVKSHMSFVEEPYVNITKEHFKQMGKEQVAKLDNPRTEEKTVKTKAEGQKPEAPKKKRNIIRVYHENNAKNEDVKNKLKRQNAERKASARPQGTTGGRPAAGPARPDVKSAEAAKPAVPGTRAAAKPDASAGKPVASSVKPVAQETVKAVPGTASQGKPETVKPAVTAAEVAVKEAPKAEAVKAEVTKAEAKKTTETKTAEAGKTAETKSEQPKTAPAKAAEVRSAQTSGKAAAQTEKPRQDRTQTGASNTDAQGTRSSRPARDNRSEGSRPDNRTAGSRDNRYGERRPAGERPFQNRGTGTGRPARQGDGVQGSRTGRTDRNDRPGQGRPQGGRPGAPAGRDQRSDNRFGNGQNRTGGRPGGRRDEAAFSPDMGKSSKDSKRERDRENKNKKKDFDNNSGRKNTQNGRKNNNDTRLPKALQKHTPVPRQEEKKPEIKEIVLPEKLTIRELADAMKMQPSVIVKKLFMQGMMVTVNHEIDFEKAQEIALDYDIIAEKEEVVDVIEELLKEDEEDEETMVSRPPVVCVMGHVDHGKTSLLDAIRKTNVTRGEAGGITQHIGASVVSINGQSITFLDTPGHEAFTAMRMRGANSTDIAILVVAADDGVMPQTVEAISHAKAAGVEIIVAINKIDKPSANIDRVKQELSEYELISEDWGGTTPMVPVSAHTGEGIDDLLEMVLLTAEVSELKANPNREARGLVIEAKLDKGKGPVATILIQKGTLHVGDFIAAGACSGKVRAMMDDKGRRLKEAGPSTPVEILGLGDVPNAGEVLMAFESDKDAKNFAAAFISENKKHLLEETKGKLSLDNLFDQIQASDLKELPIIIKADVQGSVEAVKQSLVKLSNEEVVVRVIHGGVGAINESDVSLASTSNAIIIGFNVKPDALAKQLAEQEGVDLRLYRVIYQAIEDVEAAMKGMLDPIFEEKVIGHGEVRQLFKASGIGTIAGSYVLDGIFQRSCKIRITREGEQIYEGALASLKRFKDDVKEVKAGYECGLVFEGFNDVKEEDKVEAYIMVEVPR